MASTTRGPKRRASREREVRVGISGWRYPSWRGVFYPEGLAQRRELEYASRQLRTVEINGSFYSLQRPSSYADWYAATPDDFVFAVKGGRFITHNKKLKDCAGPLSNFFASGVLALDDKLGPILWQLPPQLAFQAERIEAFLASLPRTTLEAAELARRHDARLTHGAWFDVRIDRPLRHALEVRHDSFDDPAFVRILRKANVALCVADTAGTWPCLEDVTADFVYVRLHGAERLYASGYSSHDLDRWAKRIAAWQRGETPAGASLAAPETRPPSAAGRDVYVYFDNDVKVHAPFDAMNLAARLGHGRRVPFPRGRQRARTRTSATSRTRPRATIDGATASGAGEAHEARRERRGGALPRALRGDARLRPHDGAERTRRSHGDGARRSSSRSTTLGGCTTTFASSTTASS